jgi:hypothetical protein
MGHITIDVLDDAWSFLSKAEHFLSEGLTHSSVLYCEKALDCMYRSADGMGYGVWFTGLEADARDEVGSLKFKTEPDSDLVEDLIEICHNLLRKCSDKVIPELHSRIDYDPTPNKFDVSV